MESESSDILAFTRRLYKSDLGAEDCILSLSTYDQVSMWWTSDVLFFDFLRKCTSDLNAFRSPVVRCLKYTISNLYKHAGLYFELVYDAFMHAIVKMMLLSHGHHNVNSESLPAKGKILFISQDRQWGLTKSDLDGSARKTDLFFDTILTELKKEHYDTVGIYPIDLYPIRGLKVYADKLRFADYRHVPLNLYWDKDAWIKQKRSLKLFAKNWDRFEESKKLDQLMCLGDVNLKDIIMPELSLYFHILYPHLVKYIQMARKMIQSEKPDLIIFLNEFFWWERSLLIAAEMEGVPTLAIQHGAIFPQHKSNSYTKDEINTSGDFRAPFCPIPDITLVYGPHYKDMLTKLSSYPTHSVAATGQPRYDNLIKLKDSNLDVIGRFKKKFGLPEKSRVVLWTTQCHSLPDSENKRNFSCVLNALKELDDCALVIKQHPAERRRYTRFIKERIAGSDLPVYLLPKNSDTNLLLLCCDLMVTKSSTTAIEALLLEKPIVVLNLGGEPDTVDYVKEGIAKGVYREDDLLTSIKELLETEFPKSNDREGYLRKYMSGLDGNATQNVIAEIKNFLNGKTV